MPRIDSIRHWLSRSGRSEEDGARRARTGEPAEGSRSDVSPVDWELREMWLAILQEEWWSIAVVPTDQSVSVQPVMQALARIGQLHQVRLIDAQGVSVADGLKLSAMTGQIIGVGPRSVLAVDSVVESLSGVSVVNRVSKVLLVLRFGTSRLESVESTIRIVGRERILGCVLVEGP